MGNPYVNGEQDSSPKVICDCVVFENNLMISVIKLSRVGCQAAFVLQLFSMKCYVSILDKIKSLHEKIQILHQG